MIAKTETKEINSYHQTLCETCSLKLVVGLLHLTGNTVSTQAAYLVGVM